MKILTIWLAFIFISSSCSNPAECVKSSGELKTKSNDDLVFDKILVFKGVNIVIIQGNSHKVEIQTGANLIDDIDVKVVGNQLQLRDNTTCNWVREYGETIVTITTPSLSEIYSKTEGTITGVGTLSFPNLKLLSLDNYDGLGGAGTGDFKMNVSCQNLQIESNHVSNFDIKGISENVAINVYEGNGIINTQNLIAKNTKVYHRGSNAIRLNAAQSLSGNIYNIGHVYCYTRPNIVNVIEHYRGKLIYN